MDMYSYQSYGTLAEPEYYFEFTIRSGDTGGLTIVMPDEVAGAHYLRS
jgi:hypothetical protein